MSENEKGHSHHITPVSKLNWTFFYLGCLMFLTIAAARFEVFEFLNALGPWGTNSIAMAIAVAKATFVVLTFMGLRGASRMSKYMAAIGVFAFALLGMAMFDYSYRQNEPVAGWEYKGTTSMQRNNDRNRADDRNGSWSRPPGVVKKEEDGGH
jgi:caa(3)-type oxidase subunit IV